MIKPTYEQAGQPAPHVGSVNVCRALQQLTDHDGRFHPGEGRTHAEVRSLAEGEVTFPECPIEPELVGVLEMRYLRVDRSHIIECRGEWMLRRKSVIDTHQFRTVGAGQRAVGAGRQRTTGDERPAGAASETRPKGTIGLQCPCRRVSNAILR
jgi:hypothetical protein